MSDILTLNSLPLFPLGTVLYPGGLLPLQIFEVRYLDMIGKCHKTGAPFGVVSLTEGSEVRRAVKPAAGGASAGADGFADETFNAVGTLAQIIEYSVPQPGLMVVQCQGIHRFTIARREKLKHGLWISDVVRIDDDLPVKIPHDLQKAADALGKLIKGLLNGDTPSEKMPLLPPYQLEDCGWVANRWCELLPLPLKVKQQLMELENPLLRLELVCDVLERHGISR
ncbi:Uncharacterized protein, similar to the N-terminal domain of Lon protease [Polaromonas sp. CG9_12]|uniref:LON peptidase substrate-binding domain-containing protein n=1 Tax=Polaromonas sp. CG_9.11 TaxID=2787730 RepID=UPI0004DDD3D6|nr:LON peptidase substrate-binding domain-containing protein [Polaromonas sp. CG_9.11]MBG6077734.1 Lon protease-like protein [Polaromonas sp. CG_9.11]CDS50134.1 Uncharacterized protein, similar to the N-terminal domain of Lon protease [Polaromonas sp. CG9_12]